MFVSVFGVGIGSFRSLNIVLIINFVIRERIIIFILDNVFFDLIFFIFFLS